MYIPYIPYIHDMYVCVFKMYVNIGRDPQTLGNRLVLVYDLLGTGQESE